MKGGWVCAQIGAREHYAIPRALFRRGRLGRLYTDAWAGPLLRSAGGPLRGLAERYHLELPADRVVSFTPSAVRARLRDLVFPPPDVAAIYNRFLEVGRAFGRRVAKHLAGRAEQPTAFFAYTTGALEPVKLLAGRGVPTLVDQIDPARTEEDIVLRECERWPGWAPRPGRIPDEYYARLEAEWAAADTVVVNSDWSRDALIAQGVAAEKLAVVPLAYEPPPVAADGPRPARSEFVVLWLGQVVLRKGIQYLLEAARRLRTARLRVVVAGPIGISKSAVQSSPAGVEFVGPVARSRVGELYRRADAFALPTLSDGFAITQLEAMAHGLPVVVTPNCGRVVTDGVDGRVVPAADSDALAAALDGLMSDPARTRAMGHRAVATVRRYSSDFLADHLAAIVPPDGPMPAGHGPALTGNSGPADTRHPAS